MSSVFLVSGYTPLSSCTPNSEENLTLKSELLTLSHQSAKKIATELETADIGQQEESHWKDLSLFCIGASSFIEAVSYIPVDSSKDQILFARRSSQADMTGFVSTEALLSGKLASKITWVKPDTVSEAVQGIDGQFIKEVKKILAFLLKDTNTKGISLTFPSSTETETRIWIKP